MSSLQFCFRAVGNSTANAGGTSHRLQYATRSVRRTSGFVLVGMCLGTVPAALRFRRTSPNGPQISHNLTKRQSYGLSHNGAHAFWLHPIFVALAWLRIFGVPWDPRIWFAIAVHDWGYIGKDRLDDADGETHVELGARIMTALFGEEWGRFCRYHSRCYAARDGVEPSKLCYADKLATAITPAWIYLPMAKATGDIYEYMWRSTRDGSEKRKYADCELRTALRRNGSTISGRSCCLGSKTASRIVRRLRQATRRPRSTTGMKRRWRIHHHH